MHTRWSVPTCAGKDAHRNFLQHGATDTRWAARHQQLSSPSMDSALLRWFRSLKGAARRAGAAERLLHRCCYGPYARPGRETYAVGNRGVFRPSRAGRRHLDHRPQGFHRAAVFKNWDQQSSSGLMCIRDIVGLPTFSLKLPTPVYGSRLVFIESVVILSIITSASSHSASHIHCIAHTQKVRVTTKTLFSDLFETSASRTNSNSQG